MLYLKFVLPVFLSEYTFLAPLSPALVHQFIYYNKLLQILPDNIFLFAMLQIFSTNLSRSNDTNFLENIYIQYQKADSLLVLFLYDGLDNLCANFSSKQVCDRYFGTLLTNTELIITKNHTPCELDLSVHVEQNNIHKMER